MKETALLVAGIVFLMVSIMHLARLIFRAEVRIGRFLVPLRASVFGFIVSLLLSLWMFKVGR